MQRCFTNILSSDVERTARFYELVLGMKRHFDSDWFVILIHDALDGLELGVLQRNHEVVPLSVRTPPSGVMLTFVVADCDSVHKLAFANSVSMIEPPTDMPYGQRRMLLQDPDGTIVDVSSKIP